MKNKNILKLIVVLGIIIGGFYVVSRTGNQNDKTGNTNEISTTEQTLLDTSDWETCRNEEYGYEFKYPKEWYMYNSNESYSKYSPIIVKEGNNCVSGVIISSNILHIPSKKNKFNLQFSVVKESQDRLLGTIYEGSQSLDEYFSKVTPKFLELHTIINKNYIDGEEALWLKQKNIDNTFFIWFFHNNSLFKINIKGQVLNPDLLDAITTTFKFID